MWWNLRDRWKVSGVWFQVSENGGMRTEDRGQQTENKEVGSGNAEVGIVRLRIMDCAGLGESDSIPCFRIHVDLTPKALCAMLIAVNLEP